MSSSSQEDLDKYYEVVRNAVDSAGNVMTNE